MKTSQFSQLLSLSRTKTELKGAEKGNSQAFTLIELLLVIAIVGILAGIVMVGMSDAVDRARIAKIQGWSDSVRISLMGSRVSEWKFDEAAGTLALDTVGTNNGMLYNGTAWTTSSCVSGACLSFDGVDDYVRSNSMPQTYSGLTLSLWANPYVNNAAQIAYSQGSDQLKGVSIRFNSDGRISAIFSINGTDAGAKGCTGGSYSADEWIHIATVFNGTDGLLYVNGSYVCSVPIASPTIYANSASAFIGRDGYYTQYFKGELDEVRVYNAALPASAIRDNYLAGLDQLLNQITQQEYRQRLADLDSAYAARE